MTLSHTIGALVSRTRDASMTGPGQQPALRAAITCLCAAERSRGIGDMREALWQLDAAIAVIRMAECHAELPAQRETNKALRLHALRAYSALMALTH